MGDSPPSAVEELCMGGPPKISFDAGIPSDAAAHSMASREPGEKSNWNRGGLTVSDECSDLQEQLQLSEA